MNFDKELDARGLNCPLPILRTKKALADLQSGQVLKVIATDPGVALDMPMWCRATRHEHIATFRDGAAWKSYVRKRA